MINIAALWIMLLPIVLSLGIFFLIPRITKNGISVKQSAAISAILFALSAVLITVFFAASHGIQTADTEILNGEVVSKERVHDKYKESYDCNCKSVSSCSGSGKDRSCSSRSVCDTCYRDHYTVTWNCITSIGNFEIDKKDWTSSSVYDEPDLPRFTIIKKGDPASRTHSYTNYIKAVPSTLFRPAQETLKTRYASQIPEYPINVYDFYKVDRIVPVGVSIPNIREWNNLLSEKLKTLGPLKQANVVIVITKIADPDYFYALQDAWQNGKKNDIVVVIGAPEFPKAANWVQVMALTQNNIFQVKLRDDILALTDLTADNVIAAIDKNTRESFQRKRMRDFEYLDNEIDPPLWIYVLTMLSIIAMYSGTVFYEYRQSNRFSNFKRRR